MKVVALFAVLAILFSVWRLTARRDRKAVKKALFPLVVPALLAGIVTIALLVFALTFNGKLI